jgi:CBS domain-containing protein
MLIKEIMTPNPEIVRFEDPVIKAAKVMKEINVGAIPIFDGEDAVGLVTDRDITIRLVAEGRDPKTLKVGDIMSSEVITCKDNADAQEAAKIMKQKNVRRLLVKNEQNKIVGLVTLGDLATSIGKEVSGDVLQEISKPARPER